MTTPWINQNVPQPRPLRPGDAMIVTLIGGPLLSVVTDVIPVDAERRITVAVPPGAKLVPPFGQNDNEAKP